VRNLSQTPGVNRHKNLRKSPGEFLHRNLNPLPVTPPQNPRSIGQTPQPQLSAPKPRIHIHHRKSTMRATRSSSVDSLDATGTFHSAMPKITTETRLFRQSESSGILKQYAASCTHKSHNSQFESFQAPIPL
jgi:hypothetical protein